MDTFRPILTSVAITIVLGVVFRWLWKSAAIERSQFETGRQVFPPWKSETFEVTYEDPESADEPEGEFVDESAD